MRNAIWLVLGVNPEPWAIGPVGFRRHEGKLGAYVGRNQQLDAYQNAIREAASEIWGGLPPLEGRIGLRFYFWRNRAEYTTAVQKKHRKHEADNTNMQKATEDALQGILFANDRDVDDVRSIEVEQSADAVGKVVVAIWIVTDLDDVMADIPEVVHQKIHASNEIILPASQEYAYDQETLF